MSIQDLKNKYIDERVFLIGNGPSLDKTPLEFLKGEYSIALNGINDIYTNTSWRPDFYVLLLDDFYKKGYGENLKYNLKLDIDCITLSKHKRKIGHTNNIHYVDKIPLKYTPVGNNYCFHDLTVEDVSSMNLRELNSFWSDNLEEVLYTYHSMYALIQIAAYLGFKELILIGCDLGYDYHDPHMLFNDGLDPFQWSDGKISFLLESYKSNVLIKSMLNGVIFYILTSRYINMVDSFFNQTIIEDTSRFSLHSQLKPEDNSHVNDEIIKSHVAAKRITDDKEIKVFNATIGGNLEVYPKIDFNNLFC